MTSPYLGLPDFQFWKREPGVSVPRMLDPVTHSGRRVTRVERIVTAGSCFAQHVAHRLTASGFNHHITERAHPIVPPAVGAAHNYGMFSARYGNIYTAGQLLQLLKRAYGLFEPQELSWPGKDGDRVVDPFRPRIQPGGFLSETELMRDRSQHFAAVRRAIEEMDVFVFTLGLTEAWRDRRDGAIFPIAPGVAGGEYRQHSVEFVNFDEVATYSDLAEALCFIRAKNPSVRFILTVSPVPLNATYEPRHVLLSTTWSKAVLRISAERAVREFDDSIYFPSYEIITSPHVGGRYYAADRREVTPAGVDHVMDLFFKHLTYSPEHPPRSQVIPSPEADVEAHVAEMATRMEVLCDEAAIDNR